MCNNLILLVVVLAVLVVVVLSSQKENFRDDIFLRKKLYPYGSIYGLHYKNCGTNHFFTGYPQNDKVY